MKSELKEKSYLHKPQSSSGTTDIDVFYTLALSFLAPAGRYVYRKALSLSFAPEGAVYESPLTRTNQTNWNA